MTDLNLHLEAISQNTKKAIAFFDLDKTLIGGYSITALAWETVRHGTEQGNLQQAIKLFRAALHNRVEGSGTSYQNLVTRLSRTLAGVSEDTLEQLGQQAYHRHIARSLYREAIALIETHRAAGHQLVIVSAASRYQIEPVARVLGIERICCTRLEVRDGTFTGQLIAPLCYGEGKTLAARREARRHHAKMQHCWFYSDSAEDLPLLRTVGNPVAVNPSERLSEEASRQGWPQLRFHTRGLPTLESIARTGLTLNALTATTAIGYAAKKLRLDPSRNANRLTQLLGDLGSGFAGLDFEIEGSENLCRKQPAVFVFNHQSLLDSMVLAHLLREDVVALCKQEMANKPVIGPLLRQVDTIFVDRDEQDQGAVLKKALAVLNSGRSLVIAPEGKRSTLGNIQTFKHGAFFLARKAAVPIIPIILHNVKDALPNGGLLIRPATIRITVLPPIPPQDIQGIRKSCLRLEQRYAQLLGESRLAALPHRASA